MRLDTQFETGCEMMDGTSCSRPDPRWRFLDAHGHLHQWHTAKGPATTYLPSVRYELPTLIWIHEEWGYYPDGDGRYSIGHYECRECADRIPAPGLTADTHRQMIPGLRWYRINGESATKEQYEKAVAEFLEEHPHGR